MTIGRSAQMRKSPSWIAKLVAAGVMFPALATPVVAETLERSWPIFSYDSLHQPVVGQNGMVVTQHVLASEIGAEILERGGNAVDAAVAVGLALAVTLPRAGNLGGGGFMMIYLADENRTVAIDCRETAPAAARQDMFLDENGDFDEEKAWYSHLSSGVPGTVKGMAHAVEKYGTMSWADVIKPALRLAKKGFPVTYDMADALKRNQDWLTRNPATRGALFKDGVAYEANEVIRQPDLAKTLEELRESGPEAFYSGRIAALIVDEMRRGGGIITKEDLADYTVVERQPVAGTYKGYDIVSVPPPSSGGVHLIEMLNILEHFDLPASGRGSADTIHVMAEAMKLAFADRSKYLGDPGFVSVPIAGLTSKSYAERLAGSIRLSRARPAREVGPGDPWPYESPDTTHYSIMDHRGNAVSNTYTINFSFGSGIMVSGAGFLLNNEMDDFAAKPGVPNAYGLVGGEANMIEPGKRPISSMTPTFVFHNGKPMMVVGTPGGSHIITAVMQIIVDVIDFGLNVAEAVHQPRFHHQWLPDRLEIEPGFSPDTVRLLQARGHRVELLDWASCSVQAIVRRDGLYYGGADPRRPDARAIGIQ